MYENVDLEDLTAPSHGAKLYSEDEALGTAHTRFGHVVRRASLVRSMEAYWPPRVFVYCTKSVLENILIMSSHKYRVNKDSNLHIRQRDCARISGGSSSLPSHPASTPISKSCHHLLHRFSYTSSPRYFSLLVSSNISLASSTPDQSEPPSFRERKKHWTVYTT